MCSNLLSAIILVAHEKSGTLSGLKHDLAEQAWSVLFPKFTLDSRALLSPFLHSIIYRVPSAKKSTGGTFELVWYHILVGHCHVVNDYWSGSGCLNLVQHVTLAQ